MTNTIANLLIDLIKTTSVVVLSAYLISRTRFFSEILERRHTVRNILIAILVFGALSVFGTYGGVKLPSGAIANIRDLGPLVAGLFGGPLIGLGAGIIGGVQRYFMGGIVAVPCSISPIIAGLLGGLIFVMRKGRHLRIWQVMVVSAGMELLHMGLTLAIARPYDQALAIVEAVVIPMTISNAVGSGIFAFIIINLIKERKATAEKAQ